MIKSRCFRLSAVVLLAVLLPCVASERAENHLFMMEGALQVRGEIVSIEGDRVLIKREDGRVLSIKRSFFSIPSQKYISKWERGGDIPVKSTSEPADTIPDTVLIQKELCPTNVTLTESIEFKTRAIAGRSEKIVVPAGTEVHVLSLNRREFMVEYQKAQAWVKIVQTDVLKRIDSLRHLTEQNRGEKAKQISKYPILEKAGYGRLKFHVENYEWHHIEIVDPWGQTYKIGNYIYSEWSNIRVKKEDSHFKYQNLYILTDFGNLLDEFVIRAGSRSGFSFGPADIPREGLLKMKSLAKMLVQARSRKDETGASQAWDELHTLASSVKLALIDLEPLEDVQLLPPQPKPKDAGKDKGNWQWGTPDKVEIGEKLRDYVSTIQSCLALDDLTANVAGRSFFPSTSKKELHTKDMRKEEALRKVTGVKALETFLVKFIQKIEAATQSSSKWVRTANSKYLPGEPIELVVWGDVVDTVILAPEYREENKVDLEDWYKHHDKPTCTRGPGPLR